MMGGAAWRMAGIRVTKTLMLIKSEYNMNESELEIESYTKLL